MMTKEQREIVISQYQRGVPPVEIARQVYSTSQAVVQMARRAGCAPRNQKLAACGHKSANVRRQKKVQEERNAKLAAGLLSRVSHKAAKRDAEMLMALIPDDTRSFTARFCGDPLPGRSALDRRPLDQLQGSQR